MFLKPRIPALSCNWCCGALRRKAPVGAALP